MVVHQRVEAPQTAAAVFGAPAASPLERLQLQAGDERGAQAADLGAGPGRGRRPPPRLTARPSQPRADGGRGGGREW